jgi:hypothetical protein
LSSIRPIALVLAGAGGLGLVLLVLWAGGADVVKLTRDPANTEHFPASTGFFSTLGLLGWATAAGACMLAAIVMGRRDPRRSRFFAATAALIALLALDDAYLLHDDVAPEKLGVSQEPVYLLLAGTAAAWALWFRDDILRSDLVVFGCVVVAFATSIVMDVLETGLVSLEDWFKLSGILALTVWCFTEAIGSLRRSTLGP